MPYLKTEAFTLPSVLNSIRSFAKSQGWQDTPIYKTTTVVTHGTSSTTTDVYSRIRPTLSVPLVSSGQYYTTGMVPTLGGQVVTTEAAVSLGALYVKDLTPTSRETSVTVVVGYELTRGRFTVYIDMVDDGIRIKGSRAGKHSLVEAGIYDDGQWPLTLHMFAETGPDFFSCIATPDNVHHRWVAFGVLRKFGDWVGGEWFGGSHYYVGEPGFMVSYLPGSIQSVLSVPPGFIKASSARTYRSGGWYANTFIGGPFGDNAGKFPKSPGNLLTASYLRCSDLYCELTNGWSTNNRTNPRNSFENTHTPVLGVNGWPEEATHGTLCGSLYQYSQVGVTSPLIPFWVSVPVKAATGINTATRLVGEIPWIRGTTLTAGAIGSIEKMGENEWIRFPWTALGNEQTWYDVVNASFTLDNTCGNLGWALPYKVTL